MKNRERLRTVFNFEPFDHLPLVEWAAWWGETTTRWQSEGLPFEPNDTVGIQRHFGLEVWQREWIRASHWETPKPAHHGAGILQDESGYENLLKYFYTFPWNDLDWWKRKWDELRRRQEEEDIVVWLSLDGFFWWPRALFGIERHLYAFYDQPELMHRINRDLTEWSLRLLDVLTQHYRPDFFCWSEDMSYNHGPMLSKELFDEFMLPYYQQITPVLHALDVPVIIDSDGDITMAAAWFNEAGIEGILPLERQAGVDVAKLRALYPRMVFVGCYDKMVMTQGEDAMRAEFERLLPVAARGGLVVSVDHQTPPGVSLANYEIYIRLFREYADKAGELSRSLLPT